MSIVLHVSALALRQLVDGAWEAVGGKEGGAAVVRFLTDRFTDHSQRLNRALSSATESAWKALELALAGESFWARLRALSGRREDQAFAQQVRAFLDAVGPAGPTDSEPAFRRHCLRELRAARKAGLLTSGELSPEHLARQVGAFARFTDAPALLEAEWRLVGALAEALVEAGWDNLGRLLALRPAEGESVLALGARYFFRRAVEKDEVLFRGLAFARLEKLSQAQEQGFAALADALAREGQRLEELLTDVRETVVEAHGAVLDLQAQIQGQGENLQQIGRSVLQLLEQHQLQRRELRLGDSLSVRNDGERQLVRQLVARYRALPEEEQRRLPALLNALGKLEVVAGDFEAAQRDFQSVARLTPDAALEAEAHYHAYQAALQRRDWTTAQSEMLAAARLAPQRLAPFPLDKYEPERILGAGGFGVAFLCRHVYVGGRVVVKALGGTELDQSVEQVFAEGMALRQLDHPAIIRMQDCGFTDPGRKGRPYLAMDYFDGATLEELAGQQALSEQECVAVAQQIASALQAAHGKGILHRDVKPANVLLRRLPSPRGGRGVGGEGANWEVKLIDFGLALGASALQGTRATSKTLLGSSIAGTLEYAAPEQLGRLDGVPPSPASDVYGFAKTCCYALFQVAEPTLRHYQSIKPALADLLGQCLERLPARRPQDFGVVLTRLSALSSDTVQREAERREEERQRREAALRLEQQERHWREAAEGERRREEQERQLRQAADRAQEERQRLEEQERRLREATARAEEERLRLEREHRRAAEKPREVFPVPRPAEPARKEPPKQQPAPAPAQTAPKTDPNAMPVGCHVLFWGAVVLGIVALVLWNKSKEKRNAPQLILSAGASTSTGEHPAHLTVRPGRTVEVAIDVVRTDWLFWQPAVLKRADTTKLVTLREIKVPVSQKKVTLRVEVPKGTSPGFQTIQLVSWLGDRSWTLDIPIRVFYKEEDFKEKEEKDRKEWEDKQRKEREEKEREWKERKEKEWKEKERKEKEWKGVKKA
jgi:Protein kinase domain